MSTAVMEAAAGSQAAAPPAQNLKVRDLKEGAFARLKAEFKNPTDAIEILNYIDFLAQNNSMSADDMELPFKSGERHEWKLTRAEVTQLFFGHLEAKSEEIKKSVVLPDDSAQKAILDAMKARANSAKAAFEQRIDSNVASAMDFLRRANDSLIMARKMREEAEALSTPDAFALRLKAVVDGLPSTNWNFHKFANNTLEFVSRSDIMLRHIEPKAGLHYELNCGKFRLAFRLDQMVPKLFAHERCVPSGVSGVHPNIHPHVSTMNEICFGNAAASYAQAQVSGDILAIIKIIDALLPNYGDQPFVSIANFKKAIEERDRREKENYGKKKEAPGSSGATDEDILDDEPEFFDDIEWSDGSSDE
jgi:hypothetical protein